MTFGTLFALTPQAPQGQPQTPSLFSALVPFILVFGIFYLLIIMPQRKKQKKHMAMIEQLKPGDRLITTGGIFGTVMGVQKDRIELKIAANTKIDITRSAVGAILGQAEGAEPKD
jgi:preprotein translocase subunit YajC